MAVPAKVPLKVLNLSKLPRFNILSQLHLEELLLRGSTDNWFIYNTGRPRPSIVVGFSGKIPELVDLQKASESSVAIIRRFTGGGTVIVDNDSLFTSFIFNGKDAACAPYPREIMTWSNHTIFGPVFQRALESEKFNLRENDYTIGDKKVGGNAQSITKDRWVHHTSFLWSFSPENMKFLKMPSKRPQYRNDREHCEFLTSLNVHFSRPADFEKLLLEQLSASFDLSNVELTESIAEQWTKELLKGRPFDSVVRTRQEHGARMGGLEPLSQNQTMTLQNTGDDKSFVSLPV